MTPANEFCPLTPASFWRKFGDKTAAVRCARAETVPIWLFPVPVDRAYQDLSHWKLAVNDIFTSSYGPADLTSVLVVMVLGLEAL